MWIFKRRERKLAVIEAACEMNNALMVISGNAELLLMERIENEKIKGHLENIIQQCRTLKDSADRLAKFSYSNRQ